MDFDEYEAQAVGTQQPDSNAASPRELTATILRAHAMGGVYYQLAETRQEMVTFRFNDAEGKLGCVSVQYVVNTTLEYDFDKIVAHFMDKRLVIHGSALDPIYTGLANRHLMMVYAAGNVHEEAQKISHGQTFVTHIDYHDLGVQNGGMPAL